MCQAEKTLSNGVRVMRDVHYGGSLPNGYLDIYYPAIGIAADDMSFRLMIYNYGTKVFAQIEVEKSSDSQSRTKK